MGRYRTRTRIRSHLPYWLTWLAPKAKRNCGDHDWYRHDDRTALCYHCEVGERSMLPTTMITINGNITERPIGSAVARGLPGRGGHARL